MQISSGVKFRCYPTDDQAKTLSQWIGCQRFIYNAKVFEENYFRTFKRKSLSMVGEQYPIDQQYSRFKNKELSPFLNDVPSEILRNGAYRFMSGYQRYCKKLAGRPVRKKKHGRQTVMITKELFWFEPTGRVVPQGDVKIREHLLMLGTQKHPLGQLKFKAHQPYALPNSITIARHAGKWFVSFSYEMTSIEDEILTEEELLARYRDYDLAKLEAITRGADRGVAIPVADSEGNNYDFNPIVKKRLEKKERYRKKLQRRFARQQDDSKRKKKTRRTIEKLYDYEANVRADQAHKVSRKLVDSDAQIFAFEDLKVKNMTRRPKPKQDENGQWVKNGAAAKSGLNKAILSSTWGKTTSFTKYKARKVNKLVVVVPPHGTSQECSRCGHTHPDNRETQALFVCTNCGFTLNADYNAALVIKKRAIKAIVAGTIEVKQKKTVRFTKDKQHLGMGQPKVKSAAGDSSTLAGPGKYCRAGGSRKTSCGTPQAAAPENRETPTTTAALAVV